MPDEPKPDYAAILRRWADELGDMSDPTVYEDWQREEQAQMRAAAVAFDRMRTVLTEAVDEVRLFGTVSFGLASRMVEAIDA